MIKVLAILLPPVLLLLTFWLRYQRKKAKGGAKAGQAGGAEGNRRYGRVMLLLWTLVLPLPALLLTSLVHRVAVPLPYARVAEYSFKQPRSQQYQAIEMVIRGRGWRWSWQAGNALPVSNVEATLVLKNGERTTLMIDAQAMMTVRSGSGTAIAVLQPHPLHHAAVLTWMAAVGIDTETPAVRDEAGEIVAAVKSIVGTQRYAVTMPSFESMQTLRSASTQAEPHYMVWLYVLFWLLVWAIGAGYFSRKATRPGK